MGQDLLYFADSSAFEDTQPLTYHPCDNAYDVAAVYRSRVQYHQLPSTCCLFNKVFQRNNGLYACLYLKAGLPRAAQGSLLSWLRKHGSCVHTLASSCGTPIAGLVSRALDRRLSKLKIAEIYPASQGVVTALGAFTCLTACTLSANKARLDLKALQTLRLLTDLHLLKGTFTMAGLAASLSELILQDAHVTCPQGLDDVGALQSLDLEGSILEGIHANGLSACTGMKEFHHADSHLGAADQSQLTKIQAGSPTALPARFPALQHWSTLALVVSSQVTGRFSFTLLSTLTTLQELRFECRSEKLQVVLGENLTCLRNLYRLEILLGPPSLLILNTRWHLMKKLGIMLLEVNNFQFGANILGLTELDELQEIEISDGRPLNSETAGYFASLLYHMALLRPSVSCKVKCSQGVANQAEIFSYLKGLLRD